eukprot:2975709-Amphidinium_carterae.1
MFCSPKDLLPRAPLRLYGPERAGTAHSTCVQAGYQVGLRRETARAYSQHCAAICLDVQKAYEHVGHEQRLSAIHETNIPWAVLKGALKLYSVPRLLQWNGEIVCAGQDIGASLTPG